MNHDIANRLGTHSVLVALFATQIAAGHGRRHATSEAQSPAHYRDRYAAQYAELGAGDRYEYHVHDGGNTTRVEVTIDYVRRRFGATR